MALSFIQKYRYVMSVAAFALGLSGCGQADDKSFHLKFTCLAGGPTGCDYKLFFRTPDKKGDFAEGTSEQPSYENPEASWEIELGLNQVCDTPISTAPDANGMPTVLKIDGTPVAGDFARGLMVAVGDRTGHYYGVDWRGGLPACNDAFEVEVNGLVVPTVPIEGMLPAPTRKPFENCLISEAYLRGSTARPLCVILK